MATTKKNPDWLKINDDGSITVTLSQPLMLNGEKLMALTMREPSLDDQLASAEGRGGTEQKEKLYLANLCDVPPVEMGSIKLRDYMRLQTAHALFID